MPRNWLAVALALAPACRMDHGLSQADLVAYDQLAGDLSLQVQAYCAAAPAMMSPQECAASMQHYLSRARPDVAGMGPLAERMDEHMPGMGAMGAGDMRCGMGLVSSELDRHAGAGCASGDMAANRAEAARHCGEMQGYVDHMRMRGSQAGMMMGSGGMMGPGGMDCCSYTQGGWLFPDGGWMGWDHHLPGCFAPDGG